MNLTEKELEALLQKNPSLRVREKGAPKHTPLFPPSSSTAKDIVLKRMNKYGNKKLYEYANGQVSESKNEKNCGKIIYVFDSIKEYRRWKELQLLEKSGEITHLKRQEPLLIQPSFSYRNEGIRKIEYVADFIYERSEK